MLVGMLICPECGANRATKAGYAWTHRTKVQRYRCSDCGRLFVPAVDVDASICPNEKETENDTSG